MRSAPSMRNSQVAELAAVGKRAGNQIAAQLAESQEVSSKATGEELLPIQHIHHSYSSFDQCAAIGVGWSGPENYTPRPDGNVGWSESGSPQHGGFA